MVDRTRLLVAALAVVGGVALFMLGSGPGALGGGTVVPNEVPAANVTAAPDDGTVTVRHAGPGDWESATLTVTWNGSLSVVAGERRLAAVGDRVVLAEPDGAGETTVGLTVTARGDGRETVVYEETLRV